MGARSRRRAATVLFSRCPSCQTIGGVKFNLVLPSSVHEADNKLRPSVTTHTTVTFSTSLFAFYFTLKKKNHSVCRGECVDVPRS